MSNATNLGGLDALLNGNDDGFNSLMNNRDYYTPTSMADSVQDTTKGVSLDNMIGLSQLVYSGADGGALPDIGKSVFVNGVEYTVIDNEDENGYQGLALYDQSSNSIIVVNRGTEPSSLSDWATDAQMALTATSPQWAEASALGQRVADYAAANGITAIYTTGHSLGGTLTEMQAARFGWQGYTFNAYGASEIYAQLVQKNLVPPVSPNAHVTNYRTMFDLVSDASTHIGAPPISIETTQDATLLGSFFDLINPTQSFALDLLATVGEDHLISNFYGANEPIGSLFGGVNNIFTQAPGFSVTPSPQVLAIAEFVISAAAELIHLELETFVGPFPSGNLSLQQSAEELMQLISNEPVSGIKTLVPSDSTLLSNALNPAATNNAYRAALAALSPVVLQGPDPSSYANASLWAPGLTTGLTKDYLVARNDMVQAGITFAGNGQSVGGGIVTTNSSNSYVYTDLARLASPLYTMNGQGGSTYDVVFAGNTDTTLTVSPGAYAELFGGAGNDILFGGTVGSTLQGGAGNDEYIINGAGTGVDYVLDTDGQGTIEWKSSSGSTETLTGGNDQAGTPDWKSADGLFTYTEDLAADGSTELEVISGNKTVYIDDFTNGEFGINLSTPSTAPLPNGTLQVDAQNSFSPGLISAVEFDDSGSQAPIAAVLVGPTDTSGQIWAINGIGNASSIYGGSGAEFLIADSRALDSVSGSVDTQSFYIQAGTGAQSIVGAQGHDTLVGGSDTLTATTVQVTYSDGTTATLQGERGFDWITGGGGNDLIEAGAGSTLIDGGTGNDTIFGGNGNDTIYADLSYYGDGQGDDAIANLYDSTGVVDDTYLQGIGGTGFAGAGAVTGTSANLIIAGAGNDLIFGGLGNDTIYGGMGKDTIVGNAGSNIIYGGTGQSVIYADENPALVATNGTVWQDAGSTYSDTIIGGTGDSTIFGSGGNDVIEAGGGNDQIVLGNGNSHVWGDEGNVTIAGSKGNDVIDAGSGNDYINVGAGNSSVFTGSGNNTIYAGTGSDTIIAGSGADTIIGSSGMITYIASTNTGSATIQHGSGNIALQLTDGLTESNLLVRDVGGDLVLSDPGFSTQITIEGYFSNANGVSFQFDDGTSWGAAQILKASITARTDGGNDTLIGSDGNDSITAGYGDTLIVGVFGNNTLTGGAGNDTIQGSNGADLIEGGEGTTQITGGTGSETYLFQVGDGSDTITENITAAGTDTLRFGAGITASDVNFTRIPSTNDLLIQFGPTTDATVTVKNFLASSLSQHQISTFQFADGTTISSLSILQELSAINGTTGNDYLVGTSGTDYFDGDGGYDQEIGNGGEDTFVFNKGYGVLTISENFSGGQQPVLKLGAGIAVTDLRVETDGNDIDLYEGNGGDRIILKQMWIGGDYGVSLIELADGTTLTRDQLIQMEMTGTTGNDYIYGERANLLDGKGGDDTIRGGGGQDTFVFNPGYGQLQIDEYNENIVDAIGDAVFVPTEAVLELGAGIAVSALHFTAENGEMVLTDGIDGDKIILDGMDVPYGGVSLIKLADGTTISRTQMLNMEMAGTTGNDSIIGTNGSELIDGKGGDDTINGEGLSDTFVFNQRYGHLEIIEDNDDGAAVLKLGTGITASMLRVTVNNVSDMFLTDGISGDQINLYGMWGGSLPYGTYSEKSGVSSVQLSDGTTLTSTQLIQMEMTGTTGNDMIDGKTSADLLDGKGGNDLVVGYGGSDTFVFNSAYGHLEIDESYNTDNSEQPVLQVGTGIKASALDVTTNGTDLILTDGVSGDQITLDSMWSTSGYGVATVQFADGTTLTGAQLIQMEMTGTTGNDTIYGTSDADLIDGKGGNDSVVGGSGSDTFVFDSGYGHLEINESYASGQQPVLQLGAGITASALEVTTDGTNLLLTDGINGDQIQLDNETSSSGSYGVQTVQLADGTTLTQAQLTQMANASPGNGDPTGGSGNDTLTADTANQTLTGGTGTEIFDFNVGFGQDTLVANSAAVANTIQFGTGITVSDLSFSTDGSELVITATNSTGADGQASSITLPDHWINNGEPVTDVGELVFSDGSSVSMTQINQLFVPPPPPPPVTTPTTVLTAGSDNTLVSDNGDDLLQANDGNDTLTGGSGTDTLESGVGNTLMTGGTGDEAYLFNTGFGQDTVEANGTASSNTIQFGAGITVSDLSFSTDGSELVVTATNSTGADGQASSITLPDHWINNGEPVTDVGEFVFSDGSSVSMTQINQLFAADFTNEEDQASTASASSVNRQALLSQADMAITPSGPGASPTSDASGSGGALATTHAPTASDSTWVRQINPLIHAMASYTGSGLEGGMAFQASQAVSNDLMLHAAA